MTTPRRLITTIPVAMLVFLAGILTLRGQAAPDSCYPYSVLTCDQLPVELPYTVEWEGPDAPVAEITDTGFTMVDPPSNPTGVPDYPTPDDPQVPGFASEKLSISGGDLVITSTKGLQIRDLALDPAGNSLVNGLGVAVDPSIPLVVETQIVMPDMAPGTNNSQQGGLWVGADEDNYVKLVIIKTGESYDGSGNSAAKVELSSERRIGADLTYFSIDTATISDAINTQVITLRMVIDPATGRATGFYSLDGTTFTQVVDSDTPANDSVIVSDGYFAGVTLPDGTTGPVSFAGVFGSHRNADPEDTIDYAFEYFMVDGTNEAPVLDPLVDQENNEGDTGIAVLVTATDPEDDDLAFAASGLPAGLTIDPDTGLITGDLGFDTAGIYSVEITVTDDGAPARTTTGTFSWIVNPVNRSPVVTPLPDRTDAEGDAVSFQVEAVDPDDDPLLYSADNLPEGVLIDENTGLISGVLEADAGGVYEVVVTATDDKNASDSTVFTWTVTFTGNLMRNASFEDGFDDWNQIGRVRIDVEASQFLFVSDTDCDAPSPVDGTCVMVFESTGVIEAVEQTIPVIAGVAGDSYTLTYWVSSEGVFGSSVQGVLAAWSNNVTDEIGTQLCTFNITGTTPMTQVTCPFTTTFDYDRLNIKLGASINNGQYVVDDVVLLKD